MIISNDLTYTILNIIGDDEYPVGWVIEQIRRRINLPHDYPIWEEIRSLAHADILDVRMGSVTYMVRKHQ